MVINTKKHCIEKILNLMIIRICSIRQYIVINSQAYGSLNIRVLNVIVECGQRYKITHC